MEIVPVTRKEKFIKAAIDGVPLSIDAIPRIEMYLAKISGDNVDLPDPITRIEKYLAVIAGMDVVLPSPVTRVEKYLAKIAGMDVETPDPVTRIEMLLDEWVESSGGVLKTVSGAIVSVSDALKKAIISLVVSLEPIQDLHGYANPWPAGGGKNKIPTIPGGSRNGITAVSNSDGSITLNGTSSSAAQFISEQFVIKAGTYVLSGNTETSGASVLFLENVPGSSDRGNPVTLTFAEDKTTRAICQVYPGKTVTNLTMFPMLRASTESATYAPYSNICPISGHDSVKVWVKPTYDPTANPTATIQLGQTVYGGELDVTTGVLTVNSALEVFDTVTTWGLKSNIGIDYISPATNVNDLGDVVRISFNVEGNYSLYDRISSGYANKMCNMAKHYFSYNDTSVHWYRNSVLYLFLPKSVCGSTTAEVMDYLISIKDTNPLSLWIPLATPITYQLTPTEIEMLEGNNTLWADTGDITLTYMADGNANDVEALNILLGNRYVNLGEPDEATDKEALDILLGGR